MDSLSPAAPCERVVFVKSAQCGGTEVLLNTCGYLMHHAPAPTLLVQPSVEMAKRFSKQRLDALIESTPVLRGRVKDPRSRDSGNTVLMKEFAGGVLILTGANSAVGLRSLPAKYVLCDELDGWLADADNEGDPFTLACKRTVAFGSQRKILAVSTPTLEGLSRIEALYRASDQRRYLVPCPRCGYYQVLAWANVVWEKDRPDTARHRCEACEALIENWQKTEMLSCGEWRATAAGDGKTRGYHISALYAPVGWPDVATLARDRVRDGQIFVRTLKTGGMVYLPVPHDLQTALEALPDPRGAGSEPRYFFWNGITSKRAVVGIAERTMAAVFKKSKVPDAGAHRFRHTLATRLLGIGASEPEVADVLGISAAIVRKHYAKWSQQRQQRITTLMLAVNSCTNPVQQEKAPVTHLSYRGKSGAERGT